MYRRTFQSAQRNFLIRYLNLIRTDQMEFAVRENLCLSSILSFFRSCLSCFRLLERMKFCEWRQGKRKSKQGIEKFFRKQPGTARLQTFRLPFRIAWMTGWTTIHLSLPGQKIATPESEILTVPGWRGYLQFSGISQKLIFFKQLFRFPSENRTELLNGADGEILQKEKIISDIFLLKQVPAQGVSGKVPSLCHRRRPTPDRGGYILCRTEKP